MRKWWFIFPALKPERAFVSHVGLWVGILLHWREITNFWVFTGVLLAFLLFYGALYVMNDVADYKLDKRDRHNKGRLIASGSISRNEAWSWIVPIWIITLVILFWFSQKLAGIVLILWGMNILYSWVIKAIPYVDILFIALTQPIKFFVALYLCGNFAPSIFLSLPLLLVIYFIAVLLHTEKQIGKLQGNRQRTFLFGGFSVKYLRIVGDSSLVLGIASALYLYGNPEFVWAFVIVLVGLILRFGFSAENALSYITRAETIFQPR